MRWRILWRRGNGGGWGFNRGGGVDGRREGEEIRASTVVGVRRGRGGGGVGGGGGGGWYVKWFFGCWRRG